MKLLKLIAILIALPLALAGYGGWQLQRAYEHGQQRESFAAYLQSVVPDLEKLAAEPGLHFVEMDGQRETVQIALGKINPLLDDLSLLHRIGQVMSALAIAQVALGVLAAAVGLLGLFALARAGRQAMHSRERLLQSFQGVRAWLPWLLVAHMLCMSLAVAAGISFEGLGLWHEGRMSAGEFKGMMLLLAMAAGCVYSMWRLGKHLKLMLAMFEPTPMEVLGEQVSEAQAPALWAWVRELAQRLGAPVPDHILIGLEQGFYVTSSDIDLQPAGTTLQGCTLHVPLAYLGLLGPDEATAVVGHELGHFVGADTEYSRRFMPIYDGIGRSLGLIDLHISESGKLQRLLLRPALMLGELFIERFDHAVSHWSRVRELAADATGAQLAGAPVAASALLRVTLLEPLLFQALLEQVQHTLKHGVAATQDLPSELIASVSAQTLVVEDEQMAVQQPHPSDTHPSNGERLAALRVPTESVIAQAARPIEAAQALARMDSYFSEPQALRAKLTSNYLDHHVREDAEAAAHLQELASLVQGEVVLCENAHVRGWLFAALGAGLALLALAFLLGWITSHRGQAMEWVGLVIALFAGICLLVGVQGINRSRQPALVLGDEHLSFLNLKAPLPIADIDDFRMSLLHGVRLEFVLAKQAPLPELTQRRLLHAQARLDRKRRVVSLQLARLCRDGKVLKAPELAELILQYLNAGMARRALAERAQR